MSENNWLSAVRFGPDGLVPVVAQERRSGDVLMVAYADREALERIDKKLDKQLRPKRKRKTA